MIKSMQIQFVIAFIINIALVQGASSEPMRYAMNELVKGKQFTILVASAKNEGNKITESIGGFNTQNIVLSKKEYYLLRISVEIVSNDNKPIMFKYFIPAIVKDIEENNYKYWAVGPPGFYYDMDKKDQQKAMPISHKGVVDYIFNIPNNAKIVEFIWSDLPSITLHITK
jgi:hypothetical protein